MNDRELLELAAKAAGMETKIDRATGQVRARVPNSGPTFPVWNPLTDDGDALRLAVKLRLDILVDGNDSPNAHVEVVANQPNVEAQPWAAESMKFDQFAATRRAIVRAAAEIGRAM